MQLEITFERKEAYSEIIKILSCMDRRYVEKIPNKLREFFKDNSLIDYNFDVDMNKPLLEQNLKRKTLSILAMLNINYWCEDEKHRQDLLNRYNENEKIYLESLREKYNPDNLFKKKEIEQEGTLEKETSLVVIKKEKWYNKFFNKIKKLLNNRM